MTLMRYDPFRDLDRLAERAFGGSRGPHAMPMEVITLRSTVTPTSAGSKVEIGTHADQSRTIETGSREPTHA